MAFDPDGIFGRGQGSSISLGGTPNPAVRFTGGGTRRSSSTPSTSSSRYASPEAIKAVNSRKTYGSRLGDPYSAVGGVVKGLADDYDAQAAAIREQYSSSMPSLAGYQSAINEALKLIADVDANREALNEVYDEYDEFVSPFSEEAIKAAVATVEHGTPVLDKVAEDAQKGIARNYGAAGGAVSRAAKLIGAGGAAKKSVVEETTEGEEIRADHAEKEATGRERQLALQAEAQRTAAVAARDLDNELMARNRLLSNIEFDDMREQAEAQLAAARQAAAAAAARRAALARERDAALAALSSEKAQALRLNPHEAGEATALQYLGNNARGLDYNRQQLVTSTVSNALSEQVPAQHVRPWLQSKGMNNLSEDEIRLVQGSLQSYTIGMRWQQNMDRARFSSLPSQVR